MSAVKGWQRVEWAPQLGKPGPVQPRRPVVHLVNLGPPCAGGSTRKTCGRVGAMCRRRLQAPC